MADPKEFEELKDVESEEDGETAAEEKDRIMSENLRPNWLVTTSSPWLPLIETVTRFKP